ncbi:hypothetical protein APHAL10511_007112 [Amanita phalloides]|nr:hypothetical protein APHAL10511_007112 [Amanita phalloides]
MSAIVLSQPYRPLQPPVRRIHFAPLPDPRRSPSLPDFPLADDASSASSSSPPHRRVSYPVESYPSPPLNSPLQADPYDSTPKFKRKFLLPIFRKSTGSGSASPSSSLSLTPTPSIDNSHTKHTSRRFHISAEDILTLGTIKLFRSVYRNNRYVIDNDTPSEWELSRWASINSAQSAPAATLNNASILGPSLARSQSGQLLSKGNDSGQRNSLSARSVTNGGKVSASHINQTPRRGMRMLNGRVYGAPKRSKNPFDNVRDEADPEFVEWGYGGMGSVSGRHAAGMGGTRWERLHSGQSSVDPSLDDGGGMGWVKKRREAKERERKIKEQEAEEINDSTKGAADGNTKVESTSSATSSPPPNYAISPEGEHDLHAVTIPANFQRHHHHHHHHHHHQRSTSKGSPVPDANDDAMTGDQRVENKSSSTEESEWEETEEQDSESDPALGQSRRKTAVGAGVEKYTRHRDA